MIWVSFLPIFSHYSSLVAQLNSPWQSINSKNFAYKIWFITNLECFRRNRMFCRNISTFNSIGTLLCKHLESCPLILSVNAIIKTQFSWLCQQNQHIKYCFCKKGRHSVIVPLGKIMVYIQMRRLKKHLRVFHFGKH